MIITKTPFRMSFFGGGTDMEDYFRKNGGAVLSTTFDKYCYVTVRHLPRFFDYSTELSYSKTERVTSIEDIQHPAIRNAMKMLDMHEIRLTYEADLPARSGLGTSSSFAVGSLHAEHAALVADQSAHGVLLDELEAVAQNVLVQRGHVISLGVHEVVQIAVVVAVLGVSALHSAVLELGAGVEGLLTDRAGHHVLVLGTHESGALAGLDVLEVHDQHGLTVHLKYNTLTEIACGNRHS